MHVLCCPDKFRGSIDAAAAARALAAGVERAGLEARAHPLADGGEGTLDAVLETAGGDVRPVAVREANGSEKRARLGLLRSGEALVELAEAAGHAESETGERDPMDASTAGVGAMIGAALDSDAERVIVAVGGSATVDGGLGALRALGARLEDASGAELGGSGADLARLARIDPSRLDPRLAGRLEIACDVLSPLSGPGGAARVFGPQKGASAAQVAELDAGLERLGDLLALPAGERERCGAAGGFPAPFVALAGAKIHSGAELVRSLTGFEAALADSIACITGEGRVDRSTLLGKTVLGVTHAARARGVPVVVVGGTVEREAEALYEEGAAAILGLGLGPRSLAEAERSAHDDLEWVGRAVAGMIGAAGEG